MLEPSAAEPLLSRLTAQFPEIDRRAVERCVRDTCACAEHLGVGVTPCLVEGLVREHLTAIAKGNVRRGDPPAAGS